MKKNPAFVSDAFQKATETSAGKGPVLVSRGSRDTDHLRRIFDRETREVAELDQLGGTGVFSGQKG
jgi:hypothetical protein